VLFVVLSAYFGIIFWISRWICRRKGWSEMWVRPWVWVGVEFLRGHWPAGGFPWSQLGYSQGGFLAFIQVSDLFGVYAVTWLLAFINEALALALERWKNGEGARAWKPLAIAACLFGANLAYGSFRFRQAAPTPSRTLQAGIVQGNIPQEEKWLRSAARKIVEIYRRGTVEVEARGAQLVIWPEASWPLELAYDDEEIPHDLGLSRADLLFGVVSRSRHRDPSGPSTVYNTALLADAGGRVLGYYHKRHLVPFGEYVPWREYLFFARKMTAEVGDLEPGSEYRSIPYQNSPFGVLICYEDIFPEISRRMAAAGAQALINISNDAWYGRSSAAYQHQVFSQFRSVETRRATVRSTNTGLSSSIDRWGRVLWQGELFERQDFVTELSFYSERSLYVRIGDVLPYFSLGLTGLFVLMAWAKKTKPGNF